jgi:hypothetical protein
MAEAASTTICPGAETAAAEMSAVPAVRVELEAWEGLAA